MKTSSLYNIYDENAHTTSLNTIEKNISSYNTTLKTKKNFQEETVRIDHLYIKENIAITNWEESRYSRIIYDIDIFDPDVSQIEYLTEDEKKKRYHKEEDEIYCGRFYHLNYCGCKYPCSVILNKISPIELSEQIFAGSIESAYKTKELLKLKITHVLNVSSMAYTRRKYFKYLDIFIADNHTENAIKFFKITNRFIEDAIKQGQKILIHSLQGRSRCWVFLIAFLIGKLRMKYTKAVEYVKERFPSAEMNDNFLTQLKHYDLEMNVI